MPRYPIVIEQGDRNYSAYAPDVPGCVAVGSTIDETTQHMAEALAFHIQMLLENGEPIPEPGESVAYVEV